MDTLLNSISNDTDDADDISIGLSEISSDFSELSS